MAGGGGLQRRDVPPGGVAAQLGPFLAPFDAPDGPPAPCRTGTTPPVVEPSRSTVAVGGQLAICTRGFAAGPVDMQVRLPDGGVRPLAPVSGPGPASSSLTVAVLDPLGPYVVTARQVAASASAEVTVKLPDVPVVDAMGPTSGPPGTTFRFAVAGPAPNRTVDLDVYVDGVGGRYVTTPAPARLAGSGRVVYELPTRSDDPPGSYCVVARRPRPDPGDCARFRVT